MNQKPWGNTAACWLPWSLMLSFLIQTRSTYSSAAHSGLDPPPSVNNQNSPLQVSLMSMPSGKFFSGNSFLRWSWAVSSWQAKFTRTPLRIFWMANRSTEKVSNLPSDTKVVHGSLGFDLRCLSPGLASSYRGPEHASFLSWTSSRSRIPLFNPCPMRPAASNWHWRTARPPTDAQAPPAC